MVGNSEKLIKSSSFQREIVLCIKSIELVVDRKRNVDFYQTVKSIIFNSI